MCVKVQDFEYAIYFLETVRKYSENITFRESLGLCKTADFTNQMLEHEQLNSELQRVAHVYH